MNTVAPTLLSQAHVNRALSDLNFYNVMPEFLPLKAKIQTMKAEQQSANIKRSGCGGCRERRMASNIFSDFMHIVTSLDKEGIERLKRYFGINSIMVNLIDRHGKANLTIL